MVQKNIEKLLKGRFLSKFKIVQHYYEKNIPTTLEVHPSYPCNYNCTWCIDEYLKAVPNEKGYNINRDCKAMLTHENMEDIIIGCKELGIKGIILSGGGEPTLNKETEFLVEEANREGIVIGMFTNGSLLNDENIPKYIGNLSFIRFSFDDYSAESYSKTKGVPERMYDKVIGNIKQCVAYKKRPPESKCRIGIDFILIPSNIDKMIDIYVETRKLGVDYLQFCDCIEQGYTFNNVTKDKILNNLENIFSYQNTHKCNLDVVYEPLQEGNDTTCSECGATDYIFLVGADGRVQPCPHLARHSELSYGNINEKSLKEIWRKRPIKLDTVMYWHNCRFREQNRILQALKNIEHPELI
ncbi:MAG: radical SAM/SPASM domain-containing protein [Candidatus Hermodarchaeota archaeon]